MVYASPAVAQADDAVHVLVFRAGSHQCCVPLSSVEKVVAVTAMEPLPGAASALIGLFNYRGAVTVVLDVRQRFGEAGKPIELEQKLVLVESSKRLVALLCDSVADVAEISPDQIVSLGEFVPGAGRIQGSAPFGSDLLYLYDVELLLSPAEEASLAAALANREGAGA